MMLLDKVATKVHLTYDDGGENHKERVLVYIRVGTVDSLVLYSYYSLQGDTEYQHVHLIHFFSGSFW